MKTPLALAGSKSKFSFKTVSVVVMLFGSICSQAQVSTDQNFAYGQKKAEVNLSITPSKEFKAGVVSVDSTATKLKLWICNGKERRCTVTIGNAEGILWNTNFRDVYYSEVYDLSSLDDGIYTMSISDGKKSVEKTLVINSTTYLVRNLNVQ